LIATTEGLTLATTLAISGSSGVSFSVVGGVQLGSIGVVVLGAGELGGGELGGGEVSTGGKVQLKEHPIHRLRDRIRISKATKYFMPALFITDSIVARR